MKPDKKFENIILKDLGRRPTTIHDVRGLLTLIDKTQGNIMEIGAWYGRTTYEMAVRFPEKTFYTVDWLENEISEREQNARAPIEDLCKYARDLPNVSYEYKPSDTINYNNYDNISMIFVDGDHSFEGCYKDTMLALNYLKNKPGSILCWHDVRNGTFGVKSVIDKHIAPHYDYNIFDSSQLGYIIL